LRAPHCAEGTTLLPFSVITLEARDAGACDGKAVP